MATPSPEGGDSLRSRSLATEQDDQNAGRKSPVSAGKARQTRRLQLRSAGFRGAALPARRITPKAFSSSSWSSSGGGMNAASDAENTAPAGARSVTPLTSTRVSNGVLQEIGNSTITHRPKKARHRISSKTFDYNATLRDRSSPSPPPTASMRRQSVKSKAKDVSIRQRSASAEMSKYIEHLESELATAHSELSNMTSAGATKEQSAKMRSLTAESKKLQEGLSEWEAKYEQRVQEEVDRHLTIESDLKAQIRHLEQDAEDAKFRIQELEMQLDTTAQNMQAVETANVGLEKRLEMMSELLASTKVDLHADTPGRAKRQSRPKSMLPRFPTASALMTSPERESRTQPTSPLASFPPIGVNMLQSPRHSIISLNASSEHTDFMSEAGSIFSEGSTTGDSMTSAENVDSQPNYNPWNLPPRQNSTAKPARRMRRFGAGSLGPKPLILPSTSQCEYFPPASPPPLEHSKTSPAFFERRRDVSVEIESPLTVRRRASTMANDSGLSTRAVPPFLKLTEQDFRGEAITSLSRPSSSGSYSSTRRHSSLESAVGRNLMEELGAMISVETTSSDEQSDEACDEEGVPAELAEPIISADLEAIEADVPPPCFGSSDIVPATSGAEPLAETPATQSTETDASPESGVTMKSGHRRGRSRNMSIAASTSETMLGRIRLLFGDLWRSPIVMARYLIQTAQARMQIPRPLMNVQWWLVGVLFGPLARRHMKASRGRCDSTKDPRLLSNAAGHVQHNENDAASDLTTLPPDRSPDASPETLNNQSKMRGRSKTRCVHRRGKHSPWLWLKFSLTLAFAIGTAFKDGPGSLLITSACHCRRRDGLVSRMASERRALC